jgi:hypothetical protein
MKRLIALLLALAVSPVYAYPPPPPHDRPICPTYYNLGYEVTLTKAAIIAPGLARVVVRSDADLMLIVAQVVDRDGKLYGEPVAVPSWPRNRAREILIAVPPEPFTPRYDVVPGVLVRTWRGQDAASLYQCRQAVLLPGARVYVPWVERGY